MKSNTAVRSAWHKNLAVNRVLLRHLKADMMEAKTPGGGYTVAQHLAHIVASIKYWGMKIESDALGELPDLFDPEAADFVAEHDLDRIEHVMSKTSEAAIAAAESRPDGAVELPHEDSSAYLIHMMVHDAHHRGQILLALKASGFRLPDEDDLWSPWRS